MSTGEPLQEPQEVSIQARLCNGSRYHSVGDLLTYRSGLWMVKGFFLGANPSGERELYYILGGVTAASEQAGDE
ncbi:MAG TPA: hypothetical protein VJT32_12605 [bacterium]|nr:hypothetical protein [bacterium]